MLHDAGIKSVAPILKSFFNVYIHLIAKMMFNLSSSSLQYWITSSDVDLYFVAAAGAFRIGILCILSFSKFTKK